MPNPEILNQAQYQSRLQMMKAKFVPKKSTQKRHVYWSDKFKSWILAKKQWNGIKVGYYQTEDCPCDD